MELFNWAQERYMMNSGCKQKYMISCNVYIWNAEDSDDTKQQLSLEDFTFQTFWSLASSYCTLDWVDKSHAGLLYYFQPFSLLSQSCDAQSLWKRLYHKISCVWKRLLSKIIPFFRFSHLTSIMIKLFPVWLKRDFCQSRIIFLNVRCILLDLKSPTMEWVLTIVDLKSMILWVR